MIRVNIVKSLIVTNTYTAPEAEAQTWLNREISNGSFGKPERWVKEDQEDISNALDTRETEFGTEYLLASEYLVEIEDVSREHKLNKIRELRKPLMAEADLLVNIAYDKTSGIAGAKAYRQALRDITEAFKADMSLLDSVDPETLVFPAK